MIMDVIERHPDSYVFKESDKRAYDDFEMRAIEYIRQLIDGVIPSFVLIKALQEAHDLYWMLDFFEGSKVIWMYRDYRDVVNSNMQRFKSKRNYIDEIVKDPRRGFWRGLGMTSETLSIVRQHYSDDLDDFSAQALFWYYRNQLFFDQHFDTDERSLLIKYEPFVKNAQKYVDFISEFVGLEPKQDIAKKVHSSSIRKSTSPNIRSDIALLCDQMQNRLDTVFNQQAGKIVD